MENTSSNSSESLWRGQLSADQRAALRPQPELAIEAQLTAALAKIPAAPVASNFTARVMAAIELDEARTARTRSGHWQWRSLWPRLAVATAVLVFAGLSLQRYEANSQRATMVKNVALVAAAPPLPSVEALNNFDAIQRMSQRADDQLLALMQ
jgi:negative regulator of sigma E activity